MKTSINAITSTSGHISGIKFLIFATALIVPAATGLAQSFWSGGSNDFNNASYWSGTFNYSTPLASGLPADVNNEGSNDVVLIQPGDPIWNHAGLIAGSLANTSGAYLQTGSTNNAGSSPGTTYNLRLGELAGAYGSYVLSNGVVNVTGYTSLGEAGAGYLEVDGGIYNAGIVTDPGICAGYGDINGAGGNGTMVVTGGIVTNYQETWFGEEYSSSIGHFMMSGGVFNAKNWFVLGRNGGVGYGVMTGGTINFTGGGQFLVGGGGLGSLIQSGGTINVYNQYLVPQSGNLTTDVGTNILSGTAVLNVHDWLAVGRNSGYGELDISGGASITRDNANDSGANFDVGASARGILNQNGGAITNLAGHTYIGESGTGTWNLNSGIASLGAMIIGLNGSASGTFNLNGGTLQTSGIGAGSGGSEINFNGGTLQASANNLNFISGITFAQVSSPGGAVIDSQSYNITIPQQLNDNGNGPLTKLGTGTLTLTGQNTYAGTTTVSAGTLNTTTASTGAGAYSVAGGATLGVQVASQNTQLVAAGLTLGSSSTLNIDLNTFGNPSSAPIDVAGGALTVSGPVTLNVAAEGPLTVGQFSLITYSSQSGSANFQLGTLPSGVGGYISNNVNNSSIDLVVTSAGAPRWDGTVNGNWDVNTTANWIDLATSASETFQNGEPVVFNDSASGTTAITVVAPSVSPGGITVNNTALSYSFTGSGQINGTGGLLKEGTNSLSILNSANGYTGATVLGGGTLNVTNLANGGLASAIGASSTNPANLVLEGGTLAYSGPAVSINRGYTTADTNSAIDINTVSNLTLSGTVTALPGAGFIKSGPAQLAYANTSPNTLSDVLGYNVQEGTVLFENSGTNNIVGSFDIGSSNSVNATIVLTNSAVVNLLSGGDLDIADSHGSALTNNGVVNQSGGILNVPSGYQTWIGQNSNGVGIYNLSGGTFNANNWVAIGRANGNGTFNLSGSGALNIVSGNGGNLDIGTSAGIGGDVGSGVLNQIGGTVSNTTAQTWLGEGVSGEPATGTWNMSGGTAWLGETFVGLAGIGTNYLNLSGTANMNILNNNAFIVGDNSGVTGILTIGSASAPGGTLTLNSGADFDVGNSGNGVLNMVANGGGTLAMQGTLYLTRGSSSSGYVYLNSGATIIAGYVNNGWGFNQGISNNPEAFYFNGGTLQAYTGSQYFIQPYVNAIIETNGAIINDGGYTIWAECVFADASGSTAGLTKLGSGTLNLTAANTYTGMTVVSNGTLEAYTLAGGVTVDSGATLLNANTINGPVTVNSGGTLGGSVGSANTMAVNNTLTLSAGSTTVMPIAPASNAQIVGLTGVAYGGSLIVSNVSNTPLTVGAQYKLFNSANPGTGNFSTVTVLPMGGGTFNPATGILTITSSGGITMNTPYVSNGNLVLTGTGGTASGNYILLSSTNLLIPVSNWVTNTSGSFNGSGAFSNGLPFAGSAPHEFFILKTQ